MQCGPVSVRRLGTEHRRQRRSGAHSFASLSPGWLSVWVLLFLTSLAPLRLCYWKSLRPTHGGEPVRSGRQATGRLSEQAGRDSGWFAGEEGPLQSVPKGIAPVLGCLSSWRTQTGPNRSGKVSPESSVSQAPTPRRTRGSHRTAMLRGKFYYSERTHGTAHETCMRHQVDPGTIQVQASYVLPPLPPREVSLRNTWAAFLPSEARLSLRAQRFDHGLVTQAPSLPAQLLQSRLPGEKRVSARSHGICTNSLGKLSPRRSELWAHKQPRQHRNVPKAKEFKRTKAGPASRASKGQPPAFTFPCTQPGVI